MRSSHLIRTLALPLFVAADLFGFGSSAEWPDETNPSVFNGKTVPPPTYLKMDTFDDAVKDGYWLVEFFSPYCHHCQAFAPTWKTLYEYYYTQDPVPQTSDAGDSDLNSFTRFYDFHFAKVDCVADGDLCSKMGVRSYPSSKFYKKGEVMKEILGRRDLKTMSDGVEEVLESIRPGTRPQGGPSLPKEGDVEAPAVPVNAPGDIAAPTKPLGEQTKDVLVATPIATSQLHATPNHVGKSQPLTAESFQRLVTMTRDPWFIKFYTPWCSHCQKMAPNWQGMARQMQGQLNIGEVNCEVEKRLCKDVNVRGYPTILFFRGAERIEYDGLRGLGDLVSYANKAVTVCQGVKNVTAEEFEAMEEHEEVIFIYFYDHATTSEDFAALERIPMLLIGHAKLVKSNDPALAERFKINTWPRYVVSRSGKARNYTPLSPQAMRDTRAVLGWMRRNWLPIVPELTASNAHEVMDGKLVVLGILYRDHEHEFASAKREIKTAALEWIDKQDAALKLALQEKRDEKQLLLEEAEDRDDQRGLRSAKTRVVNINQIRDQMPNVGFAWVDGVFWERWIKTTFGISTKDGAKVVVNDEDGKRYWDVTATGHPITPSRTSILETLRQIVSHSPRVSSNTKLTVIGHLLWVIRRHIVEHPIISAGLGLLLIFAIWWSSKTIVWRSGERAYGYFRVGEKGGPMDGLLGVNGGAGTGGTNGALGKKD